MDEKPKARLILNDEEKFELYPCEYDVVICCKTAEEQKEVLELIKELRNRKKA